MGILQARIWTGSPCPPPGDLPNPGVRPAVSYICCIAGGFFTIWATGEALCPIGWIQLFRRWLCSICAGVVWLPKRTGTVGKVTKHSILHPGNTGISNSTPPILNLIFNTNKNCPSSCIFYFNSCHTISGRQNPKATPITPHTVGKTYEAGRTALPGLGHTDRQRWRDFANVIKAPNWFALTSSKRDREKREMKLNGPDCIRWAL